MTGTVSQGHDVAVTQTQTITLSGPAVREQALAEAEFAAGHTGFYPRLLADAGLDLARLRAEGRGIEALPFTSKRDYNRHYPVGVVARGKTLDEPNTLVSSSSGTLGERLTTISYLSDLAKRQHATMSVHPLFRDVLASLSHQRVCRFAAPNCSDVECSVPTTTVQDRILRDGTLVLSVAHDLFATPTQMLDQAIDEIRDYRPDWLYVDATHLSLLIERLRERGIAKLGCKAVLLTYTAVTATARAQAARYFGSRIPQVEVVSMSELGWIAMECPQGRLHLNTSSFHLELLPAELGTENVTGELVVTSLGDRILPHVRYRTGDIYSLLPPCPCGHDHPAARHEGRWSDLLTLPGGRIVTSKQVDAALATVPGVQAYNLHQIRTDWFRCRFRTPNGDVVAAPAEVTAALRTLLGDVRLEVTGGDYVPGQTSGKFLCCTTEVKS